MSDFKGALKTVKDLFRKYANQDEDANSISKKELKVLLQQEFEADYGCSDGKDRLDDFKELDKNEDNVVDFNEFCDLFTDLLKIFFLDI